MRFSLVLQFESILSHKIVRVIIVGGGAAGIFCAIRLGEIGMRNVTILEKNSEILKKLRISGGGRCNVTHRYSSPSQFSKNYPRGARILKQNLNIFSAEDMYTWLNHRGVQLKTESDGRIFPISDDSQTIIDCFEKELKLYNTTILFNIEVQSIAVNHKKFLIDTNVKSYEADIVIVASGGAQKARELELYQKLNIPTIAPVPSLFTFKINDKELTQLMGLSIQNVRTRIVGTDLKENGPILITHWGLSGPGILKLSAWGAFLLNEKKYQFQVAINWLGDASDEEIKALLDQSIATYPQAKIINRRLEKLPQRFWEYILAKSSVDNQKKWSELSKKNMNKLIETLSNTIFEVSGKTTFKEEFVTAGGIDLDGLHLKTMESKWIPNLYFIGEVTNIDGITGGFNFQNAWTSATVCALDIKRKTLL